MSMMGYEEKDIEHMLAAIRHSLLFNAVRQARYVREGLYQTQEFLEGLLEEGRV